MSELALSRSRPRILAVSILALAGAWSLIAPTASHAQTFFTPNKEDANGNPVPLSFITPANRANNSVREYSEWDYFYTPHTYLNYPDMAAPNGTGNTASAAGFTPPPNSDPSNPYAFWSTANPSIKQLDTNAFITLTGKDIYSFASATSFELQDSTPFVANSVNFQWYTDGRQLDLNAIRLVATTATGTVTLAPTNFIRESQGGDAAARGFSLASRGSMQWNLTGLGITSYKIIFAATDTSSSLKGVVLDTANTYSIVTPVTRGWTGASGSNTNWSQATNWGTDGVAAMPAVPQKAENVRFTSGSSVTVDGGTKEISELQLTAPTSFSVNASSGGILQLNTGLAATPTAPATYTVSAPIKLGAFGNFQANANTTLTLAGTISSLTSEIGLLRSGAGVVRFSGANTFGGPALYDGGLTYLSGTNTYQGSTTVTSGTVVVEGNTPTTNTPSPLGSGANTVSIGNSRVNGAEAALVIGGIFEIGKSVELDDNANPKRLGAQNTGSGTATFSGTITLNSNTDNVSLWASAATDRVTFTGAITGANTVASVYKTGAGRVVFAGANKDYRFRTTVQQGTLEIATGTALANNTALIVNAGATLVVNGSVSAGSASNVAVVVNGGTIGGKGTLTRSLSLDTNDVLSPGSIGDGNSVGTLSTLAETWGNGLRLRLEMTDAAATPGVGLDKLTITGALALPATGSGITLELRSVLASGAAGLASNFMSGVDSSWVFATADSISGFLSSDFFIDTSGFQNSFPGVWSVTQNGNSLSLNYFAVPEPGSLSLLAGSMLLLGVRRPRRTSRNNSWHMVRN